MWHLFKDIPAVCINIDKRKDKRKWMERQFKKKRLNVKFLTVTRHDNPKRGCLESHLRAIQMALAKGWKRVVIFEDDAKFIEPIHKLTAPPPDWDMLYLGGTVRTVFGHNPSDELAECSWVRMACWTTHAYILNLENEKLVADIMKALIQDREIDNYYSDAIHPNYNCYMFNPMIAIQREGYSDIEGRVINYDFMPHTLRGFRKPEHRVNEDGHYVLQVGDTDVPLPKVTIVTPTKNRRHLFSLPIHCFLNQNYPKDLLEWIILDERDPEGDEPPLTDIFPNDQRIKYINLQEVQKKTYTVAHKRNIGADLAEGEIIVHMDDDDYYPPESILTRVKVLQKYRAQGVGCVGSSIIGTHDLQTGKSGFASDGPLSLSEASMGYFKAYWSQQKWDSAQETGEYRGFLAGRTHTVMDVPYSFIIIGLNHGSNITQRVGQSQASYVNGQGEANFMDTMDEEAQFLISQMTKAIKTRQTNSLEEEYKAVMGTA